MSRRRCCGYRFERHRVCLWKERLHPEEKLMAMKTLMVWLSVSQVRPLDAFIAADFDAPPYLKRKRM